MIDKIKSKNEHFKDLKLKLRRSPKQTFVEIDNILRDVQDKKAFIFLMDAHETEKEITREILESLLEIIMELNSDYLEVVKEMGFNSEPEDGLHKIFNMKNIKPLIIAAVTVGILLAVALNESVAIKIIDIITPSGVEKEEK